MYTEHELILLVDELTPEQEDAIYDEYDALIAGHGDAVRLTVTVEGRIIDGAHRLLAFLQAHEIQAKRFVEDFVTRADIAERAGVSRQAVGLWVRGERQSAFPEPYAPVAGGIWLFHDVDAWLRANLPSYDAPELGYPSHMEHQELAQLLSQHRGRQQDADSATEQLPQRRRQQDSGTQVGVGLLDLGWSAVDLDLISAAFEAASPEPAAVDRHEHTWSQVAQIQAVELTLVA